MGPAVPCLSDLMRPADPAGAGVRGAAGAHEAARAAAGRRGAGGVRTGRAGLDLLPGAGVASLPWLDGQAGAGVVSAHHRSV
jgi:hypothetical protein